MRNVSLPVWSKEYPSGLRVIAESDTRTQTVAIVVVVGSGSSSDPPGKEGLAHYVEHMAFRSRTDGKTSFENLLERAGAGQWDAMTNLDATIYLETGPKRALGAMLKVEGQRMAHTVDQIVPDAYTAQLDIVRNELRQRSETGFVGEVVGMMQSMLFAPKHPYARPVGGTHASIDTFTADDVRAFVKKHYRPDNMTLEIIGNLNPNSIEELISTSLPKELLEKSEGDESSASRPSFVFKAPPNPPKGQLVKKEASVVTPELWIGWTLPAAYGHSRAYVAFTKYALDEALRDMKKSDKDIAGVSIAVFPGKEASVLLARARLVKGDHPEASASRILDEIEELTAPSQNLNWTLVREKTFLRQKNTMVVASVLDAENILNRALARAGMAHVTGDVAAYSQLTSDFAGLDRHNETDFIQMYVNRQRARYVLFQPRTGGGETAPEIGFRGETSEEDDDTPIVADTKELERLAPGIGARNYRSITLENGLEVVLAERPGLPVVTMLVRFGVGMANDDELGAAYAASAVAKAPSGPYGEAADFGAQFMRLFGPDTIAYSMVGSSGNIEIMLAMLADGISRVMVKPEAWETFRRDQMPFRQIIEQRPEAIAERKYFAHLFPGSKHGRSFTADLSKNTTAESAQQWIKEMQVPNNGTVVIAGEFDPATVEQLVRKHMGAWQKSSRQFAPIPTFIAGNRIATEPTFFAIHRPHSTQAQIRFGCVLPPAPIAAMDARHDLGAALMHERLRLILRDKGGVTYGFRAAAWVRRGGTAYFDMSGAVDQSKLVFSLSAIRKTLDDFRENPVDARELARMKLRLARRHSARFMSNMSLASGVMSKIATGYSPADLDDFAAYLDKVTAEDVQQDFKACFAGNPTLIIVGEEAVARAAFKDGWQTTAKSE